VRDVLRVEVPFNKGSGEGSGGGERCSNGRSNGRGGEWRLRP
jgi:hypothetical protein